MDGQNGSSSICSRPHGAVTEGKKKKKIPDRVTLKKEIGLLSACTIIIGESGKQDSDQFFLFECITEELFRKSLVSFDL